MIASLKILFECIRVFNNLYAPLAAWLDLNCLTWYDEFHTASAFYGFLMLLLEGLFMLRIIWFITQDKEIEEIQGQ